MKVGRSKVLVICFTVAVLCLFGLITLTSAGSAVGFQRFGDSYIFVKRQLLSLLIGIGFMILMMNVDYKLLRKFALPLLGVSIILLLLVFFPGIGANLQGGSRWISLGGMVFQPSEFVKLTFIIYLAAWLESQAAKSKKLSREQLFQFAAIIGVVSLLIIAQPDMGTMSVIAIVSLIVFFVSGAELKQIGWLIGSGALLFLLLIKIEPYRAQRLSVFLNPSADSQGIGYHIQQALIAIGSGGLFGVGLGKSLQKFNYLPEPQSDSIFAVLSEELGLIVALLLVATFIYLFIQGLKVARKAPDTFSRLLVVGIMTTIVLQAFMNIAALSSLMPLTGIPLPFISYGGTSIIFSLAGIGIVCNVAKQCKA